MIWLCDLQIWSVPCLLPSLTHCLRVHLLYWCPWRHGQLFLGTIDLYYPVLILAHSFGFVEVWYVLLSCYSLIISSVYANVFLLWSFNFHSVWAVKMFLMFINNLDWVRRKISFFILKHQNRGLQASEEHIVVM